MDVKSLIYIFGLWILFFWLYRDYRLDAFRQNLFAIRDGLFDLALAGKVPFDSNAYGMLRKSINGTIRFGHRLGFLDIACLWFFVRGNRLTEGEAKRYQRSWQESLDKLNTDARVAAEDLRTRLHIRTLEQIILTSAFLMFTLLTLLGCVLFASLKKIATRSINRILTGPGARKLLSLYDCAATMNAG